MLSNAAAIDKITPGEALEKLLMAIESGASRGLRAMGIFEKVVQRRYIAVVREAAKCMNCARRLGRSSKVSPVVGRPPTRSCRFLERQLRLAGEVRARRDIGRRHSCDLRPRDQSHGDRSRVEGLTAVLALNP